VHRSPCSDYPALGTSFRNRPIGTVATLARILRVPGSELTEVDLLALANRASFLYRTAGEIPKPDGSVRVVLDAKLPLKAIHDRIQRNLLKTVEFPDYLQGSIKGRGQGSNARKHIGGRIIITEDIENFFPATSARVIFEIWHRFFNFPPDVAECLTKLTTKDGSLPQGAKTSPLLANLVFWQEEPVLERALRRRGIAYTRLVDDITCSAAHDLSRGEVKWTITKIRAMVGTLGFKLKQGKETIADSGSRMIATKLVVNVRVALPSQRRSKIRAAVKAFEASTRANGGTVDDKTLNRVSGQLSYLTQYHPAEGKALLDGFEESGIVFQHAIDGFLN
jgi:retron-type reverse transcriptase